MDFIRKQKGQMFDPEAVEALEGMMANGQGGERDEMD